MTSIQKTSREMMTRARLREASGRAAVFAAAELLTARMFFRFAILVYPRAPGFIQNPLARVTVKLQITFKP